MGLPLLKIEPSGVLVQKILVVFGLESVKSRNISAIRCSAALGRVQATVRVGSTGKVRRTRKSTSGIAVTGIVGKTSDGGRDRNHFPPPTTSDE
jgi:hypothetical protein